MARARASAQRARIMSVAAVSLTSPYMLSSDGTAIAASTRITARTRATSSRVKPRRMGGVSKKPTDGRPSVGLRESVRALLVLPVADLLAVTWVGGPDVGLAAAVVLALRVILERVLPGVEHAFGF